MGWSKTKTEKECSDALAEFGQAYTALPEYENNASSGAASFPVNVTYKWDKKKKLFLSVININYNSSAQDASLTLAPSEEVTAERYQLSFHPRYHDYFYDKDGKSLVIFGSSAKMYGDYTVEIIGRY